MSTGEKNSKFISFLLIFILIIAHTSTNQIDQTHEQINKSETNQRTICDQFFTLNTQAHSHKILNVQLNPIKPYIQKRKVCFLLQTNNQNLKKLWFLRVDHMPNRCLSMKNDLKFQHLSQQQHLNLIKSHQLQTNFTSNPNPSYLIAKLQIYQQCAQIVYQNSSQIHNQNPINIIIQVRECFKQLFGFPIYTKVFTQLLYAFIGVCILAIVLNKFNIV